MIHPSRRLLPAILLALLLVAGGALAVALRRPRAGQPHRAAAAAGARPAPRPAPSSPLDRRVGRVVMDPMPLGEAIDQLSCQFRTDIEVDWEACRERGFDMRPEEPAWVELRLSGVTLRQALAKLLQVRRDYDGMEITADDAGVVRVGPKPPTDEVPRDVEPPVARVYDVRDLLATLEAERGHVAAVDGRTVAYPGPSLFPPTAPPGDVGQFLEQLVIDMVATDTWVSNGGTSGSAHVLGGRLVVVQEPFYHRQVAMLLEQLRAFLRAPYEKGGALEEPRP